MNVGFIVDERKFLGYKITSEAQLCAAKQSIARFRKKVIDVTKRRTPHNLTEMIASLNPLIRGWLQYFSLAEWRSPFRDLDSWIRQRLRAIRIRQCKNPRTILLFLISSGIRGHRAATIATSGKGAWRLAHTPQVKQTMLNKWFKRQGLVELHELWETRNRHKISLMEPRGT